MRFERTDDLDRVRDIFTEPRVWEGLRDDTIARTDFEPNGDPRCWYVAMRDRDRDIGVFLFLPRNRVLWESHVAVLPWAWGMLARRAGKGAIEWFLERTECRRLIGDVAEYNVPAIRFGEACGMRRYGRNPDAVMRDGRLYALVLLGLSREEV